MLSIKKDKLGNRFIQLDKNTLASGDSIDIVNFDKLVLSPGIDFDYPAGMTRESWTDINTPFPHAWKAGDQTINLRNQLSRLPSRGKAKVVLTIPKSPYRCSIRTFMLLATLTIQQLSPRQAIYKIMLAWFNNLTMEVF